MSKFFRTLFGRNENPLETSPPPAIEKGPAYDAEHICYCVEQERTVRELEEKLRICDDPEVICMETLKAACEFYHATWAGLFDVDLELGTWSPGWYYEAISDGIDIKAVHELQSSLFLPSWVNALKRNEPLVIDDVEKLIFDSPQEYHSYKLLGVKSILVVPFGPEPVGIFAVKNPSIFKTRTSTMNSLAYVLHRAMGQKKASERASMALLPDSIQSDRDIIVNFFGNMEIYANGGVWKEHDFKSPKCSRVIAYILLQRKSAHAPYAIAEALYPEDRSDIDTINKNIRGYIYRFRKSIDPILSYPLIEYMPNGYRANPALNIMTDLQKFEDLWEQAQQNIPVSYRVELLKQAFKLYRGPVFETACHDHWLIGTATQYEMQYISLVNELLSILAKFEDYDGIHKYASKSLKLAPENVRAHYWLIFSMYRSGTIELARNTLNRTKNVLMADEYNTLRKYIAQDSFLQKSRLLDE